MGLFSKGAATGGPSVIGSPEADALNLGRLYDPLTGRIGEKINYGGDLHCMVFGPNGTGKSTRLLLPNLLGSSMLTPSDPCGRSLVVIDSKAELAAVSAPFRRKLGKVVILNPFGVLCDVPGYEDLRSQGFNPLLALDPESPGFNAQLDIQADANVTVSDEGNARFFGSSARNLVALCIGVEVIEARRQNRPPSYRYVRQNICAASDTDRLEKLVALAMESGVWALQNKAGQFMELRNSIADVVATAIDETRGLDDSEIVDDLERGTFDMRELKKQPVTVYLILPPQHLARHSKWLRMVVSSALQAVMSPRQPGQPRVLFALDEFYALGHMSIINDVWALTRGYGVQMLPILQDLNQLKDRYPKTFETFAGMCGALVTLGARDMQTANWFSKRAGDKTEIALGYNSGESSGSSGGNANSGTSEGKNYSQIKVPFLGPHRFYEMQPGFAYGWMEGIAETIPLYIPAYYQVAKLRERARANPYHGGGQSPAEPVAPRPSTAPRSHDESAVYDPIAALRELGLA